MATKVKIDAIDPNDPEFRKETGVVETNLEVQEFDTDFNGIESPEDVNDKLINYFEKIIRKSYEYKQYIGYLKNELDITQCAITPSLDIKEFDISLEFHHYPITLYEIVDTLLREELYTIPSTQNTVNMFEVMEKVMAEHYRGNIGLVPLTKTHHEMAHNGSIKIPVDSINGNFTKFVQDHKKYMSPELLDKIETAMSITREEADEFNKKLEKNILNYKVKYNKMPKEKE